MASTTARRVVAAALAVEACALVLFVVSIRSRNGNLAGVVLVFVSFAAWFVLAERLRDFDGDRQVATWVRAAIAVVMVAMVVFPARQSADAFLYGIYGRILAIHHANPWRSVPAAFPHDPIERYVGAHWVRTPSYYGPVWIGWSALTAWIVPATKLSIRLTFQLSSAAMVAAVGWLLWRRTRSLASAALVLLQPLVVLSVVNGGHNDGAVALLSVAAVLLLVPPRDEGGRTRAALAGLLFGLAAAVKATALLGPFGAVLWLLIAGRRRDAWSVATVAGAITALAFAATPGSVHGLQSAAKETSFLSIWQTVRSAAHPSLLVHGHVWGPENYSPSRLAPLLSALAVVLIAAYLRPAFARGVIPLEWMVAISLTTYLVLGSWVQPWHLIWALPLVVLSGSAVFRRVVGLHSAIILGLFQAEDWIRADLWRPLRVLVIVGVPLLILAMHLYVVVDARRSATEAQLAPTGRPSII